MATALSLRDARDGFDSVSFLFTVVNSSTSRRRLSYRVAKEFLRQFHDSCSPPSASDIVYDYPQSIPMLCSGRLSLSSVPLSASRPQESKPRILFPLTSNEG